MVGRWRRALVCRCSAAPLPARVRREHLQQGSPAFGVLSVASEQVLGGAAQQWTSADCRACQILLASQRLRATECPMLQRYGRSRDYVLAERLLVVGIDIRVRVTKAESLYGVMKISSSMVEN